MLVLVVGIAVVGGVGASRLGGAAGAVVTFTVNGSEFRYGEFINAIISFVVIAAAVFFLVVKPVNALMARRKTEPPVDGTEAVPGVPHDASGQPT